MPSQSDWRNCKKCQGLFFNGFPVKGVCPAGGQHERNDPARAFNFDIPRDTPGTDKNQPNWRNCKKCQGMFFNGFPVKGVCPAGGQHEQHNPAKASNFVVPHDVPPVELSQPEWRNCQKCQALFFNGFPIKGACPAGGQHDAARSFNFVLPRRPGNLEDDFEGNPV